jgi:hypothetical protein
VNAEEAAQVLAIAATLDFKHTPPTADDAKARAITWSAALDHDLVLADARGIVVKHYAERDETITPAMVNRAWRSIRTKRNQDAARQARSIEAVRGVPMPDVVRQMLTGLGKDEG